MEELFARLEKNLSDLAALESGGEVIEMSPEDFLKWVLNQVEVAKRDSDEIRKARLLHVSGQVSAVRKNFVGPTPTPSGSLLSVTMFKDPSQVATTSKTVEPTGALPNATAMSTNPLPNGVAGGAGKVNPGGVMPPQQAGTSGFASPAMATFAKSVEHIDNALAELTGAGKPAVEGEATGKPAVEGEAAGDATGDAATPVAKATRVIWPLDMSTDFGMGKVENPDVPVWGFDKDLNAAE